MPENSCSNVFRLWDGIPFGDPMGGEEGDFNSWGAAVPVFSATAFLIVVSSVVCGWWLWKQRFVEDGAVVWLPSMKKWVEASSRVAKAEVVFWFVLYMFCYFFLVFLFIVFFMAALKWALAEMDICPTCPKNTITIDECDNKVEEAQTAVRNGCKTDEGCCPDNKVCMSNDDSRTKVMCNPNANPAQKCPGGIQCPKCGGNSCECPS